MGAGGISVSLYSNVHALLGFANSVLIPLISWKVAINWWLHQYFDSVVSMYEDRFELYILCRKKCEKPTDNQAERTNWWKLAFGNPSVPALLDYVNISQFSLPARRTKELRALTGWYARAPSQYMLYFMKIEIFHMLPALVNSEFSSISLAYFGCPRIVE